MFDRLVSSLYSRASDAGKRQVADLVARDFEEITYRRLADRGFKPGAVIDVGAYEGSWTRLVNRVFGATPTLMVEAQAGKAAVLQKIIDDYPAVRLECAALTESSGQELTFYEMETGSSLMPEQSDVPRKATTVLSRTLDDVACGFGDQLFLKIDVQGAELRVLEGGQATLERSELVQLEVALLQYNQGAPLIAEVIAYMQTKGFLPTELAGLSRPMDVLVQLDILFAKNDSPLRCNEFYF